jgi:hypothetical protein
MVNTLLRELTFTKSSVLSSTAKKFPLQMMMVLPTVNKIDKKGLDTREGKGANSHHLRQ